MQEKVKDGPSSEFQVVGTRPVRPDGADKVTGRAKFGADLALPGQLVGKVLRSPYPHARIKSIDASAALKLPGVKAVVSRDDFLEQSSEFIPAGEMMINYRDVVRNVMAREKALYEGHPVAAVAATSAGIAKEALRLIKVDYEVLPHVIDVVEAMQPGAPLLHEEMFTAGVEPAPKTPSNVAKRLEIGHGDIAAGFKQAELVIEREFTTKPVHQGYIEPHACVASVSEDGQADVWVSTQGHWVVRAHCARLLGWDIGKVRVTAAEIGGGFGGKTVVYLEPIALALSKKARRPVKMVMTREEVFKASGPTSGAHVRVKIGAKKDGRIVAAEAELKYQAGAFAGSPVQPGAMCAYAPYDIENVRVVGYDVVTNRPKVAAYRAPGGPISEFAVESVIDEIADKLGMDAIELRLKNAAKQGTKAAYGPKFGPIGMVETLEAAKSHAHWRTPLGKTPGSRRGQRLLVQYRRRNLRVAVAQRGRHPVTHRRHAGHRRTARVAVHDGGGRAGRAAGQDPGSDRRYRPARLQLPHRRQPLDLLQRHGDGGSRSRRHEGGLQTGSEAVGVARGRGGVQRAVACVPPVPMPASMRR